KGGWERRAIWDVDRTANGLQCADVWRHLHAVLPEFERVTRQFRFAPGVGLPGRVWASGEAAWIAELGKDPNFPRGAAAAQAGLQAGVCFPIKIGDEVLGTIECFSRRVRYPDDNFLQMLAGIGRQLGQFLERTRADKARARLAAIVESSADAILSVNLEGVINTWNSGAKRIFGYTPAEAIGKSISMLVPPDHAHEETAILERIKRDEHIDHYQTVRVTKEGARLDVSLSVSPLKGPGGR